MPIGRRVVMFPMKSPTHFASWSRGRARLHALVTVATAVLFTTIFGSCGGGGGSSRSARKILLNKA